MRSANQARAAQAVYIVPTERRRSALGRRRYLVSVEKGIDGRDDANRLKSLEMYLAMELNVLREVEQPV